MALVLIDRFPSTQQQQHNLGADGTSTDLTASLLKIGNWEVLYITEIGMIGIYSAFFLCARSYVLTENSVWVFLQHRPKKKGNLLAKFFHAKQKLVWEVLLDGKHSAIKKRIEIHWSNIRALQASYSDGFGWPDTLLVVVTRYYLVL